MEFWFFPFVQVNRTGVCYVAAFAFSLSVSYGLLAVFMPGGLGVREGIIVLVLTATGLDVKVATTISVISRIWFISGEIFIFLMAILSKNTQNIK